MTRHRGDFRAWLLGASLGAGAVIPCAFLVHLAALFARTG